MVSDDKLVVADSENGLRYISPPYLTTYKYDLNPDMSDWSFRFVDRVDGSRLITLVISSEDENAFYMVDTSVRSAAQISTFGVCYLRNMVIPNCTLPPSPSITPQSLLKPTITH